MLRSSSYRTLKEKDYVIPVESFDTRADERLLEIFRYHLRRILAEYDRHDPHTRASIRQNIGAQKAIKKRIAQRSLPACPRCKSADTRRATAFWQCLNPHCKFEWNDTTTEKLIEMLKPPPPEYPKPEQPTMSPAPKETLEAHRAWAKRKHGRTW